MPLSLKPLLIVVIGPEGVLADEVDVHHFHFAVELVLDGRDLAGDFLVVFSEDIHVDINVVLHVGAQRVVFHLALDHTRKLVLV